VWTQVLFVYLFGLLRDEQECGFERAGEEKNKEIPYFFETSAVIWHSLQRIFVVSIVTNNIKISLLCQL